jgi:TolA-binding protein
VRYQGAQLTGDAVRRRSLLQGAVEGFSRFLLVNEVPEIYAESLYGRGLAFMDLGEHGKAIEDLTAASNEPRVGAKARAALEEARRRAAGRRTPAAEDPDALLGRLTDLLPRAASGDAAAEKDATALARGLAARGGPWPARVSGAVTTSLGASAPAEVRSSYGLALLALLAVDRGRCGDVGPLAEASEAVNDAGRSRHRSEILFLAAACQLNAGRAREAADGFAAVLREFPDAARAREAAYYRFRALDVARAADPGLTTAYEEALGLYLGRFGTSEGAGEARYLRGELQRSRGDCARAERDYEQVRDGAFAARARLGALECRVAALEGAPGTRPEVLSDLRAFVRSPPARDADAELVARAALLGALVAAGATPPDHAAVVELLEGFETRYPGARSLHASAGELRLSARVARADLEAARPDLEALLAASAADGDRQRLLGRLGRQLASQAERAAPPTSDQALALARKVYATLAERSGDPADRMMLASLDLRAGDAAAARRGYEEVLGRGGASAEALRGAARAAAASGDRAAALGYWRRIVEASPAGGTAWYEARLAQVMLLAEEGRFADACEVLRLSRGRATSAGADALEARLRGMEASLCR